MERVCQPVRTRPTRQTENASVRPNDASPAPPCSTPPTDQSTADGQNSQAHQLERESSINLSAFSAQSCNSHALSAASPRSYGASVGCDAVT
eukprot:489058-Rhodomonas_salina.4